MRTGILGFQPERLKQLRISADMTQAQLAELLSCSASNISKWEKGGSCPEVNSFKKICELFSVPECFLLESPIKVSGASPSFYRSQVSTQKAAWEIADARLGWIEEISYKLQESLEFPTLNIPRYNGNDVKLISDSEIEELADECRRQWGLGGGPIKDVIHTLESRGAIVARAEIGYVKMDGISKWSKVDGRPYVLLAGDKANPVRNRFDAAHELGHLVLHRNVTHEQYSASYHLIENQAHRFASSFLMPSDGFSFEVKWPTLDGLLALKSRWKVSVAAMIKRCQDLEIIDADTASRLWKGRSARRWTKSEPLDDVLEFEQPKLLRRSVMMLVEQKILSKESLRDILGIPLKDLEELCTLPRGYLNGASSESVVDIRLRASSAGKKSSHFEQAASILKFPKC
ncbi:ImmA/IrrE family metallo-endopeptidase [Azotobacter vinelandii]